MPRLNTFTSALALVLVAASPLAAATVDQVSPASPPPDDTDGSGLGIVNTALGQTVTVGKTGTLESITVFALRRTATTSDLTLDVRSLVGGVPDPLAANALAAATVANAEITATNSAGTPYDAVVFDLSSAGLFFSAGDQFAFVLNTVPGEIFSINTNFANGYAGGSRVSQNGDGTAFALSSPTDLVFTTQVDVAAIPLPAALPLLLAGLGALGAAAARRRA